MKIFFNKENLSRFLTIVLSVFFLVGCSEKMRSGNNLNRVGTLHEKSLVLPQTKVESLNSCTFDYNCRSEEVCAVLDLVSRAIKKCVDTSNICRDALCSGTAKCLPIGYASFGQSSQEITTTVSCVDGGDQSDGVPGSADGSPGDGTLSPTPSSTLVTSGLKNILANTNGNAFSFEAKNSSGELVRVVVNQPTGSQCHSEAVKAANGKLKLSILGIWKALKIPGFAGKTYQFSQADMCYSGELKSPMPTI